MDQASSTSLVEQVQEALKAPQVIMPMSEDLRRLMMFNEEMKRVGVVRKQEYNLPLIDTSGHSMQLWARSTQED